MEILDVTDWWVFTRLSRAGWHAIIGYFYVNQESELSSVLTNCQQVLDDIIGRFPEDILVLGGDFNAHVGPLDTAYVETLEMSSLRRKRVSHDKTIHPRGLLLLEFMTENCFIPVNGRTDNDFPAHCTFNEADGWSTIDLI